MKNVGLSALAVFCCLLIVLIWRAVVGEVAAKRATLKLDTRPSGAEVALGGNVLGKTPISRNDLAPGWYPLSLKNDGCAALNLQVYLDENAPLDLGTVPLAKVGSTIKIWRLVSDKESVIPLSEDTHDLEEAIRNLGFKAEVKVIFPHDSPPDLGKLIQEGLAPEVISGNDYSFFKPIMDDSALKPIQIFADEWMDALGFIVLLVPRSPNYAAARQVAVTMRESSMPRQFRWCLADAKVSDHAGLMKSEADRKSLADLSCRAMVAYVTNNSEQLRSLACPEMLAGKGAVQSRPGTNSIAEIKPVYILGNSRIGFVLGTTLAWNGSSIEGGDLFSVWVKNQKAWQLLTVAWEPSGHKLATEKIPTVAESLTEGEGQELAPPELLDPPEGAYPKPYLTGQLGDFVWKPSQSANVLAEIAEFTSGSGSYLFCQRLGLLSSGELGGERLSPDERRNWTWRVWCIGKNGQIAFSQARHFVR